MPAFKLRIAQLDLARQMETIDFIKDYICIIADNGYNALHLYLEDRIRTASYPYPSPDESYSVEQIRELDGFAHAHGVELIPGIDTFAHMERFLRHPELADLAEEREGGLTRFDLPVVQDHICITEPKTEQFLTAYLGETADLFKSEYFCVHMDEFFDFPLCSRCREAMPDRDAEERYFLNWIMTLRSVLAAHHKRMGLSSDMFEMYPRILRQLPPDIFMIDWQYQEDVRFYLGHLLDMQYEDRLRINEECHLESIASSGDLSGTNAESYLRMEKDHDRLGFLLTVWERTDAFIYRSLPQICWIGRMLRGEEPQAAWDGMMRYLFNSEDRTLSEVIRLAKLAPGYDHFYEVSEQVMFCRPYQGLPLVDFARIRATRELLALQEDKITTELGRRVWLDLKNTFEEQFIACEMKEAFQDTFDFGVTPERLARARQAAELFEKHLDEKSQQWNVFRPGILPNNLEANREEQLGALQARLSDLTCPAMLRMRYVLPDQYGVSYVRVKLQMTDGKWITLCEQDGAKADRTTDALYEFTRPVKLPAGVPSRLLIDCWGMGGRGVAFAEIRDMSGKKYYPAAVISTDGTVEHPEFLLANDADFAWFGSQSSRSAYYDRKIAQAHHCVILSLKPEN